MGFKCCKLATSADNVAELNNASSVFEWRNNKNSIHASAFKNTAKKVCPEDTLYLNR